MSPWIDKGIWTYYWVYLEGVSLNFDSSWTGSEVEICRKAYFSEWSEVVQGCRRWVGERSLEWVPSTRCYIGVRSTILVQYGEGYYSVIAGWEDVKALAQGAEYEHGSARLEIKREFGFGASTVRLIVCREFGYEQGSWFKLSVVIENICRDEWNKLLEYQQSFKVQEDYIVEYDPYTFRGNERVIEQIPQSPWQDDRSEVTNDIRHVALEALPLVLKYVNAQSEAIERGLPWDDFQWEYANDHETRVVRPHSAQTDTPLRALRLDVYLADAIHFKNDEVTLTIFRVEFSLTSITRSPTLPNNLSSCTLRLDPPYAALANATIPNLSSQIIEIPTGSQSADRVITTSGIINVNGPLQIMGSVMGDMYTGPVSGGNVGGRNNTNHFTAPPNIEAVVSAVMKVMCPAPNGEIPQTEGRRKRRRARARHDDEAEAGIDVEPPRKRRMRRSRA